MNGVVNSWQTQLCRIYFKKKLLQIFFLLQFILHSRNSKFRHSEIDIIKMIYLLDDNQYPQI